MLQLSVEVIVEHSAGEVAADHAGSLHSRQILACGEVPLFGCVVGQASPEGVLSDATVCKATLEQTFAGCVP